MIHTGKKVVNQSFVMYYLPKKEEQSRVGISLSKKMGHAVDRNLYKRQIRMMCQDLISFKDFDYDLVLILRFGYKSNDFDHNKKNLEKLLSKATML